MSRIDPHQGLMPSLLDRLIDPEADGTSWQHGYSVQQMVSAVFRDLEELLNTRQTAVGIPPELVEVRNSIVAYGMPDLTTVAAVTAAQRDAIGRILEALI
jgi:type VI secretion system protein ImpF